MCGRYSYSARALAKLARSFNLTPIDLEPQFNVAPTTFNPVVLQSDGKGPEIELLRWGLIPSWSKNATSASKCINARSETVAEKPAFRDAYRHRRCLVVADGFYEWELGTKPKRPWLFKRVDPEAPMVFAGIWERWQPPNSAAPWFTYSILTTPANPAVAPIHDRMPLMLDETAWEGWLDPKAPLEGLHALLRPWSHDLMAQAVTPRMNSVKFQGAECQKPEAPSETAQRESEANLPLNSE